MPAVSVIMTSYNHETYLSESIESVLSQSFRDFELIIIDDASEDKSRGIIENYANRDPRIKAIYHIENQGIAKTLNEGLTVAQGKYAAIAASDDIWLGHKLERQTEILDNDEELVVWSEAMIIDAEGKDTGQTFTRRYKAEGKKKTGDIFCELLWGNFICPQSIILKKALCDSAGFDNRIAYAVDYGFLIKLAKQYRFYFIAEPLVKYRSHGDNAIFKFRRAWDKDKFKIFADVIRQDNRDIPGKLKARLYSRLGRYLLKRRRRKLSRHYSLLAVRQDPFNIAYLRRLFGACFSLKYKDVS